MSTYDPRYRKGLALRKMDGPVKVSSVGTVRRLEALATLGWPRMLVLDRALGWRPSWRQIAHPTILKTTHDKVAAVYDQLSAKRGPSSRTRTLALRRGYAPPLAWDDIDDVNARPQLCPDAMRSALREAGVTDQRITRIGGDDYARLCELYGHLRGTA